MASDDDFLSRWSRRKRKVAEEETAPREISTTPDDVQPETEPETKEEEAALLQRLNLPVPESLKEGDDFSAFMKAGVPEFLKKRALRVLWRSNPVLANLDGLNDYDDDFTSPELTQKVLATGYKVGRGFVSKIADTLAEEDAELPPETPAVRPPEAKEEVEPQKEIPEAEDTMAYSEPDTPSVKPRRMRFET